MELSSWENLTKGRLEGQSTAPGAETDLYATNSTYLPPLSNLDSPHPQHLR